jgi:predicted Ser/Thr protein kinase
MNTPLSCPKCGAALPADAPEGLCPACLLSGAFPSDAGTVKMTPSQKPAAREPAPTPLPEDLAPSFPHLEILELLGRGGMGAVYKARQKHLNRFVALKILPVDASADPHFAERFQREAQALAKLNHPSIVSVFDFGESGGLFYFLMEFVDGANLRTLIQNGEMKPEAALALVPSICDALQYAHDEGVVHRDIKPENVLLDKKGRVKIADFGLAKLLGQDMAGDTLTRTGMHLGTPRYMAPEQFEKPETVDHRADIYSLGVVFYEMLTGELPMGRFAPPSQKVHVDVKLDEIVLRSLEKDVERRYQHASEIKTDVECFTRQGQKHATAGGSAVIHEADAPAVRSTAAPPVSAGEARADLTKPAVALIVSGILTAAGILTAVFALPFPTGVPAPWDAVLKAVAIAIGIVVPALIVRGGLNLLNCENYRACRLGAVLSTLSVNFVSLPVGIWALVLLSRPEVRALFRKQDDLTSGSAAAASTAAAPMAQPRLVSLPVWFWPLAFAMLMLGWLAPWLLWSFRGSGRLAAISIMGLLFASLAWRHARSVPALAKDIVGARWGPCILKILIAGSVAALGYHFLIHAFETRWESRALNWNPSALTDEELAERNKGKEYKLVRQLSAYKDQVPDVELSLGGGSWKGGWNLFGAFASVGPHNRLFNTTSVVCSLIVALVCLVQVPFCFSGTLRSSLFRLPTWSVLRASIPLTSLALLSALVAYGLLVIGHLASRQGTRSWMSFPGFSMNVESAKVMEAFEKWAQDGIHPRGVTGDKVRFNLETVPKGSLIGEVRVGQAWTPSIFDRWHWTPWGLEKSSPHVVVTTVSSTRPVETIVHIDVGWPPPESLRAAWTTEMNNLIARIREAR